MDLTKLVLVLCGLLAYAGNPFFLFAGLCVFIFSLMLNTACWNLTWRGACVRILMYLEMPDTKKRKGYKMILSLIIHDTVNNVHPVYEVHTWEKAQEIINSTKELMGETPFTWEVVGNSGN